PRQQRDRLSVWHGMCIDEGDAASTAALDELVAQAALTDARLADDGDELGLAGERPLESRLQRGHFRAAPDEAGETARAGRLESRPQSPDTGQLVETDRVG